MIKVIYPTNLTKVCNSTAMTSKEQHLVDTDFVPAIPRNMSRQVVPF